MHDDEAWFDAENGMSFDADADGDVTCLRCGKLLADCDARYGAVREVVEEHAMVCEAFGNRRA